MRRHRRDVLPRAHWIPFTLALLALVAALAVNGFTRPGGSGTARQSGNVINSADKQVAGGSVVRFDGPKLVTPRLQDQSVALTFEDGPDPLWTPQILDVLRRHKVKATFFVVGARVNQHPDLVRRIVAEGHELGLHTFNHTDLSAMPSWQRRLQLDLTRAAVAKAAGLDVRLFRPAYTGTPATLDSAMLEVIREAAGWGYSAVLADIDSQDATRPGSNVIAAAAAPIGKAGSIVLMHDGGGDRGQTVKALKLMLPELKRRGYRPLRVSEAVDLTCPQMPAPASLRVRGATLATSQQVAGWVADILFVLLVGAVALAMLRMFIQGFSAWRHSRRSRKQAPDDTYRPPLSVIVPAHNEAANIAATVESLVACAYPGVEIIVVDDGSSDGTADIVDALRFPGVTVLRQPNRGKSAALTTGIEHAKHDLLVLIDGDTIVEPDTLGLIVQPFRDPEVGGVAGNAKVANRTGVLGRWQHLEYVIAFNLDRRVFEIFDCMPTIPGALGAFRREALVAAGGISDATLAEDTDVTMAVCRAGWRVVYADTACAWTEAPSTWQGLWRQRYRWCYGTMQAMWKHRRAVLERGGSGRLGRRGLTYLTFFQLAQPLLAPIVDVYLLYTLVFEPMTWTVVLWSGIHVAQFLVAVYAFRLDRESVGPLWSLMLQQFVYRQLIYLVVIQSAMTALSGAPLRWFQPARTGEAAALTSNATLREQVVAQILRRNRSRGPLWARLCVWFGVFLVVVSGGGFAAVKVFTDRYTNALHQEDLLGSAATWNSGGFDRNGPINLLLMGIDWRQGSEMTIRADTIMVLHVPRDRSRAYLLSLPRDSLVEIPGHGRNRLNASFSLGSGAAQDRAGGGRLLAQTMAHLTGLRGFDGAALIDFYGFMEVVKLVNGVDICVDVETRSIHSGVTYRQGCTRMNGASALDYLRQRKAVAGGDYARQRHQQQFVKAIAKEIMAKDTLTDPAKLDRMIMTVGNSLTVTTGPLEPTDLLFLFKDIPVQNITLVRTPGKSTRDAQGRYLGEELQPLAYELFTAVREEKVGAFLNAHPTLRNG